MSPRIHVFLFHLQIYPIDEILSFRSAQGIFAVPINQRGIRSKLVAFVVTARLILVLSFLNPGLPLLERLLLGI